MKALLRGAIKQIVNKPLNAVGLQLGRASANKGSLVPSWKERLRLAKKLGFSPRVIFDGGAFRGLWTKEVAQMFPGAQIVMFEPNPFVQEIIQTNISRIQPPPKIFNIALGASPGKAKFNIWNASDSDTGASLLDHVAGEAHRVVEVNLETMDNIAQQTNLFPELVKLDLQGGELSALKGATQVLKRAELMIIEFGCLDAYIERATPRDLLEIMYANDYCLYDIVDYHYRPYDGALTGGDFFFVKNSSILKRYKGWE